MDLLPVLRAVLRKTGPVTITEADVFEAVRGDVMVSEPLPGQAVTVSWVETTPGDEP